MALIEIWKNPGFITYDSLIPALKKVGGGASWNSGAISRMFVRTPKQCGVSWVTREIDKHRMCGLSNSVDSSQSYDDIDFAWYAIGDGTLQIYEKGNLVYNPPVRPTYSPGDILEVQIEDIAENLGFNDNFNDNFLNRILKINK